MMRMSQSNSAEDAKEYFTDALQKSDYYINGQELQGLFHGRLAEHLGIAGNVTSEVFFSLCENRNPMNGTALTPRTNEHRRVGYDINFHCPKSVSIINALSKDNHIQDAFRETVLATMKDIEVDMMARVRKNKAFEDRRTGELIFAEFTHLTARPTDGSVPDCHLHSHCFTFNATWDEVEQQFKAGEFGNIKRDMPYYQARFHKILSDKLIALGYAIKKTGRSFEIEGVPKGIIDLFSKRTNEIGQFAKKHGITSEKELGELAARTRSKKQKGLGIDELKMEWRRQIAEFTDYQDGEQDGKIRYAAVKNLSKITTKECVSHAISHAFERASVMAERRILELAYRHSIGDESVSLDEIDQCFQNEPALIQIKDKHRIVCTTAEVLKEEKRMVGLAKKGRNRFSPIYSQIPAINLVGQQATAIDHILTTKDQVSIVMGAAGSGKTTLMQEAIAHIEKTGRQVITVAPSAQASRGVLKEEGFKNAETVAKLLLDKEMQLDLQDQVLWVDEAGLLGTRDMLAVLELVDRYNARLILGGDTRQHSAVLRGDALRILNTVGGIKAAEVNKIYRQRDVQYREAVQELAKGDVHKGFEKLDGIGAIIEINPLKPNEQLVSDYIKTVTGRKSALIVSPTHEQGKALAKDVRQKLRSSGLIGKTETFVNKYNPVNMTEAQKADWRNYEQGDVIRFTQNIAKINKGSIWSVEKIEDGSVILRDELGQRHSLPLDRAKDFGVFHRSEIGISKGDKVKITQNCFDEQGKRLNNGQSLEVMTINKQGKTVLSNPASKARFILDKEFGHIDHDYFTTSHSAQGKTVDEVFISQPAGTFAATDAKQFYVSVSRGRNAVRIYTDDKKELLEHAAAMRDRQSAIELTNMDSNFNVMAMARQKQPVNKIIEKQTPINQPAKQNRSVTYEPEI